MKLRVVAAAAAVIALAGCTSVSNAQPGAAVAPLSGCGDIQALDLPAVAQAVDDANGATKLTKAQTASILATGKFLISFKGSNPQDPQFEDQVGELGLLLVQIANPVQNGYVDNNQAPAVDRSERYLQGACGFPA